tara:strand:+ start:4241 stop:4756 length:516 start_codon:yes stop_codon:yes gene_type:complete
MISLDEQLTYLNIKNEDSKYTRVSKLMTKSFSFYTVLAAILLFLLNANSKIKLFIITLLFINALLGGLVVHARMDRIKKLVNVQNESQIITYEVLFHLLLFIIIMIFFHPPKIDKIDILYAIIMFHIVIQIYMGFFNPEIIYMNFIPKNQGLIIYTVLLLFSYTFIYFYKR